MMKLLVFVWLLLSLVCLIVTQVAAEKNGEELPAAWALVPVTLVVGPAMLVWYAIKAVVEKVMEDR